MMPRHVAVSRCRVGRAARGAQGGGGRLCTRRHARRSVRRPARRAALGADGKISDVVTAANAVSSPTPSRRTPDASEGHQHQPAPRERAPEEPVEHDPGPEWEEANQVAVTGRGRTKECRGVKPAVLSAARCARLVDPRAIPRRYRIANYIHDYGVKVSATSFPPVVCYLSCNHRRIEIAPHVAARLALDTNWAIGLVRQNIASG